MTDIREVIARAIDPFMPRCQQADAVLSAIEAAGMRIVPSEPTEAMLAAAGHDGIPTLGITKSEAAAAYRAMLAATR